MKIKGFLLRFSLVALILLGIVWFLNSQRQPAAEATATEVQTTVSITGKVTNKTDAQACLTQLKANLAAATNEDGEAYVATLVESARKATKKEMAQFFKEYDLSHQLLSFNVVKQEDTSMIIEAQQKTINLGKKKYRNHITQARHTFVKVADVWLIKETSMTNTDFID